MAVRAEALTPVSTRSEDVAAPGRGADRITRHRLPDRLFHWISAACVLVLMATAFLPILGVRFAWVQVHWLTGIALTAAVVFHVVRSLGWQRPRRMWIGAGDLAELAATFKRTFRLAGVTPVKPGKYSLAQKLIHHAFALVVLTTIVTGVLMLAKIDSPWWTRDPYWLSDAAWGVVYVLHDLASMLLITMVMAHVYFALRPEKLHFTRSMIMGWITRGEYADNHDPERWPVDR